jgi:hypothetical protein
MSSPTRKHHLAERRNKPTAEKACANLAISAFQTRLHRVNEFSTQWAAEIKGVRTFAQIEAD